MSSESSMSRSLLTSESSRSCFSVFSMFRSISSSSSSWNFRRFCKDFLESSESSMSWVPLEKFFLSGSSFSSLESSISLTLSRSKSSSCSGKSWNVFSESSPSCASSPSSNTSRCSISRSPSSSVSSWYVFLGRLCSRLWLVAKYFLECGLLLSIWSASFWSVFSGPSVFWGCGRFANSFLLPPSWNLLVSWNFELLGLGFGIGNRRVSSWSLMLFKLSWTVRNLGVGLFAWWCSTLFSSFLLSGKSSS